jgi:deoxycytidylate deaminase
VNKEAVRQLIEIVEKRRATFVGAEILDRDNRLVATGAATPVSEGAHQVFWLDDPTQADTLAQRAAILRRSDGSEQKVLNFERCPHAKYTRHFHFEIEE